MKKKVFILNIDDGNSTELEDYLNTGWQIERVDSPFYTSYGYLVYILKKENEKTI